MPQLNFLVCIFCGWPGQDSITTNWWTNETTRFRSSRTSLRELMDHFASKHGRVL